MHITEFAIKRPAGMTMVIMLFVVLGLFSYTKISANLFPKVNIPFVTIVTVYPGASSKEIETQIIDPMEEGVSSVSGLKHIQSTAYDGYGLTMLEFNMSADGDQAAIDVQKLVDGLSDELPEAAHKPLVQKYDFNAEPIMYLALSSKRPLNETYQVAKDKVKDSLDRVDGVGQVFLSGGQEREIQVIVDQNKLDAYGISLNTVQERLALENMNVPSGKLKQPETEYNLRFIGEFDSIAAIEALEIPLPQGGTIALREVATVKDTFTELSQYTRLNGATAIGITVQKQSDASVVDTAELLRQEVESLRRSLPDDFQLIITNDSSAFIEDSLFDTQRTLIEGVITTGLVLLIFLREWRSLITVMLAIPTSIIATFMMMYFMGFSFNMLSLMALSLCVGILVDDSIVVLENIYRHLAMGKSPKQAALDGRAEIGMAAIAITLSDVVVFGPIAFMTGMVGQFFKEFGLTVVAATLFSLFVSFTLTPMLASRFVKQKEPRPNPKPQQSRVGAHVVMLGNKIVGLYRKLLGWSLSNRWKIVGLVILALAASASLIPMKKIGTEFLPKPDQGEFTMSIELPAGTSLNRTDEVVTIVEQKLASLPEVADYLSIVGRGGDDYSGQAGSHTAKIIVQLLPKEARKKTISDVTSELRHWVTTIPSAKVSILEKDIVQGRNQAPVQIEITGPDQDQLVELSKDVEAITKKVPGTVDIKSTWQLGQPEIQVKIDRLRAAQYSLSVAEIAKTLRTAMEGEVQGVYREAGEEYDLRIKLNNETIKDEQALGLITISNHAGQKIYINQVANTKSTIGPTDIRHKDQRKLITIGANIKNRSLGDVVRDITNETDKLDLPEGYTITLSGETQDMQNSFRDLIQVLILSILLVYMILVMLYESYLTPFIRMLSLPCGAIGALLALYLTNNNLNIMSMIGFIMLDGLAAKNGTLLVDYTNTLVERGKDLRSALLEAGETRLRPIFMTSVTMIFGMLPTALATGAGTELRKGMAIVLIGGLFTSTLLTLVLLPVAYTLIDDFKQWLGRKLGRKKAEISI